MCPYGIKGERRKREGKEKEPIGETEKCEEERRE
jgi:hypothetical protein